MSIESLSALRAQLKARQLDGWLLPHEDEYLNEYLPAANERLAFLTGFTGSAGSALILANEAHIWVDGRYQVQVRSQVDLAQFDLHHSHEDPLTDFIATLRAGTKLGLNGYCFSADQFEAIKSAADNAGVELEDCRDDLVDLIWLQRPAGPDQAGFVLAEQFTGASCEAKRQRLSRELPAGIEVALIAQPDSVNWLCNLRGRDVPRLPVMLSRALLYKDGSLELFVDRARLPSDLALGTGVNVRTLEELEAALADLKGRKVLVDMALTPARLVNTLAYSGARVVKGQDPCLMAKACKNEVELAGMREAHLRDGVAVCQFLCWLDDEMAEGRLHNEAVLAEQLECYRLQQDAYLEPSFDTISAAGANAALPHYNHRNGEPALLEPDSVYLVDSGGQYLMGTTDVTRTVAIGNPGEEVKGFFTLVLKGHIALDRARFVKGTCGHQLDILARAPLWAQGHDYDHGTGHGVGQCLSVHEGPQRIGKSANNFPLLPGMVLSNEPGYYRAGAFGMRQENLVEVVELEARGDRPVYGFKALTWVPIDRRLIDADKLTADEKAWLNHYHQGVWERIAPHLDGHGRDWLKAACAPL
ncbi:aminopeptidase P family protein [Gallaecimonas sp. GXIMD4217]|uniref:aminopeptidase P family protein n=1 Tax=Gallaecimonas sp. GXIMD4217 TaxID=3131927 RepID=UPI00311B0D5C